METVHFIPCDFLCDLQLGYLLFEAVHSNRSIGFIQVLLDYRSTDTRVASYNERRSGRRAVVHVDGNRSRSGQYSSVTCISETRNVSLAYGNIKLFKDAWPGN